MPCPSPPETLPCNPTASSEAAKPPRGTTLKPLGAINDNVDPPWDIRSRPTTFSHHHGSCHPLSTWDNPTFQAGKRHQVRELFPPSFFFHPSSFGSHGNAARKSAGQRQPGSGKPLGRLRDLKTTSGNLQNMGFLLLWGSRVSQNI